MMQKLVYAKIVDMIDYAWVLYNINMRKQDRPQGNDATTKEANSAVEEVTSFPPHSSATDALCCRCFFNNDLKH